MAKSLRTLIVEDSENDALLVVRELKNAGYDVQGTRVETAPAMRAALGQELWDLVIADFTMPQFSAPAALSLLQEVGIDLPFIIVSGSVGEDIAVEAMKAGAHDYLVKGNLKRLAPAVKRELAEAANRRARQLAEEDYRELVALAPIGIYRVTREGRLVSANVALARMLGYDSPDELLPLDMQADIYFDAADRPRLLGELERVGTVLSAEVRVKRKAGGPIWVQIDSRAVRTGSGAFEHLECFVHDVDQRKRAEEALRASEERYRLLFDANPQPMWVFDEKALEFLAVNEAACRHYGYSREEFLGMTIEDIRPPEDVAALHHLLETERREYQESGIWRHRKKDGTVIEVEIQSSPIELSGRAAQLVLPLDVTERRQLEQQFRQAQKMEAIGHLAGGIAHDFNNLLTAILGYSELLAQRALPEEAHAEIREIHQAGERAAGLTRQLLAFSRKQVLQPAVIDVNVLVADMEKMLRRLIGEDLDLGTRLDPSTGNVRADPSQLEQIVMNLTVNARDAMPRGGKLTIETRNVEINEAYTREHPYTAPGFYVMLSVSDTGTGMDRATQARIFEPFFTTKAQGKGTGLGLSMVYGVVKQSGGSIEVYSEPGRGTTFKVYLPRVFTEVQGKPDSVRAERLGGSETILLVEDEEAVRTLGHRILDIAGYRVIDASSAEEALEVAKGHRGPLHLMVTDTVMPGASGPELARLLAPLFPGMKVLYVSGYADEAVVHHGLLKRTEAFLQKPFGPDALLRRVREVLDSPKA